MFSVDDVARAAGVPRVVVVRRCLDAAMPPWRVIDGRRYWDRRTVARAVLAARDGPPRQSAA